MELGLFWPFITSTLTSASTLQGTSSPPLTEIDSFNVPHSFLKFLKSVPFFFSPCTSQKRLPAVFLSIDPCSVHGTRGRALKWSAHRIGHVNKGNNAITAQQYQWKLLWLNPQQAVPTGFLHYECRPRLCCCELE